MIELAQTVTLFKDANKTIKQSVSIDPNDEWIIVTHHGESLSMSLENWKKLSDLVLRLVNETK